MMTACGHRTLSPTVNTRRLSSPTSLTVPHIYSLQYRTHTDQVPGEIPSVYLLSLYVGAQADVDYLKYLRLVVPFSACTAGSSETARFRFLLYAEVLTV